MHNYQRPYELSCLDVYEMKSTEYLWQARYDWPIAGRVVVEFKERSSHQLVVSRDREEGFLW